MQTKAPRERRRSGHPVSDPHWYRDAIIYELRIGAFQDSDNDGKGDFRGLTSRLDYLQDLGITAVWLLPFYPSPLRDDGYDISGYTQIHPEAGTLDDFREFLQAAHERGLRVITELVLNHTSDQHPWFQRARRAPAGSRFRDYYVWSDTHDRYREARIIFKDFERSNWTWDPVAGAYYWHRFYSHQPDLNFDNPAVRREVFRVLDFWLKLGVDGLRLDAIPYLFERDGTSCENLPETHDFLRELRRHVDEGFADRMLLAEANQWPEDAVAYFGKGDECHMSFHFPLMPRMFMALWMEDRFPVIDILKQTPPIAEGCQWALFLRNHDELTLEMVTDEERDYMYRVYAHDAQARINLGIRRRLAPLLGNDRRRIELLNALLFALPGTPVVYYGDEIGMGDNFYLGDRNGVRTPMQWSPDRNAGFSRATPQRLYLPIILDPDFHYESINVEGQRANRHSLLSWMKRLIALRRQLRAFGRGTLEFLQPTNRKVLAFLRQHENETLLVVANLSRFVQYAELDLATFQGLTLVELFGQTPFPAIGERPYFLTLGPHGFYWFRIEDPRAASNAPAPAPAVVATIELRERPERILQREGRAALERALPAIVARRRWFGGKAGAPARVVILDSVELRDQCALVLADVQQGALQNTYALTLSLARGEEAAALRERAPESVLAEVSSAAAGAEPAVLFEALEDPQLCSHLLSAIGRRRRLRAETGELVLTPMNSFRALAGEDSGALRPALLRGEQSNSSVAFGERLVLKIFRRIADGVNPELEMGRFLSERTEFAHIAPLAGVLEFHMPRREPLSIGILQGFVPNQGDAWSYMLDRVRVFFERVLAEAPRVPAPARPLLERIHLEVPQLAADLLGSDLETARLLGLRTAQLHRALASDREDPAFAPEPLTALYRRSLYQSLRNRARATFQLLAERAAALPPNVQLSAEAIASLEEGSLALMGRLLELHSAGQRIRCHGDFHLGQVLHTGSDLVVIDFEGEPGLSMAERRLKRSPLRDVAGMLRSLDYASQALLASPEGRLVVREEDVVQLDVWARFWRDWTSSAFLRAYLSQAEGDGLLPRDEAQTRALLTALILEKNLYELGYELNNRPAWTALALRGVQQLIAEAGA